MLKKSFIYIAGVVLFATACEKPEPLKGEESKIAAVSLINASSKNLNFLVNGELKNVNGGLAANGGIVLGTYIGIDPSAASTVIAKDFTTSAEYVVTSVAGEANSAHSLYVYDTVKDGKLKSIYLTADRSIESANVSTSKIRFLNLSPKSPDLDCWLVRIVGAVRTDSIKLASSVPYLGNVASPNAATLSTYTSVRPSQLAGANGTGSLVTSYALKVTLGGTNTVVTTATTNIVQNRNYTLYVRSLYPGTGLSLVADN